MKLPRETPVMTLPNATLFPQTLMPLYIFEPRYRQMLADALHSNRVFAVAMQKPGSSRETPLPIAGLGVIRVSVRHNNDTSHLILQGVARVELEQTVRYKPYRVQRIRPLETPPCDTVAVDALMAKLRELVRERIALGIPLLQMFSSSPETLETPATFSPDKILEYLDSLTDPEQAADQVSRTILSRSDERQAILETIDIESRLRRLIQFLLADIRKQRKGGT